jgi:ABC-type multidrug transport system fused ATPase/permease subunit
MRQLKRVKWREFAIVRASNLLSRKERMKIFAVIAAQVAMGVIDLVAIALVGVLGSLAVTGIASQDPNSRISQVLKILHLSNLKFQQQAGWLGVLAAVLLISRTVLSIVFSRRILYFLSRRAAVISGNLLSGLLRQSLMFVQGRTTQQTLYSLTQGVSSITVGIIGTTISIVADLSLLGVISAGLFIVDPITSISMLVVFSILGFTLYKVMDVRAHSLGMKAAALEIESSERIVEVLHSYREFVVRNRRNYYAEKISRIRLDLADTQAELAFMPNISKYVIESAVVLGALSIGAIQFMLQDAKHAVATLSIFLTAGLRIAPAALRLQQGAVQLRMTMGAATSTLNLIDSLAKNQPKIIDSSLPETSFEKLAFNPQIEVRNVSFTYPNKLKPAVNNLTFEIKPGEFFAIVGSSGAGKTTLVDILLGILTPESGEIEISGTPPSRAIDIWPGALAYVPQDVSITNGNIRQNVALGFDTTDGDDRKVWDCLEVAQLKNFVKQLPEQLNSIVGEKGAKLSGGQRQRLGIARALFTQPKLLVLDEATSSLDAQTEQDFSEALMAMRGKVTLVVIAHRLSTIREANKIIYLDKGSMMGIGGFSELRERIPEFDKQARLMGM